MTTTAPPNARERYRALFMAGNMLFAIMSVCIILLMTYGLYGAFIEQVHINCYYKFGSDFTGNEPLQQCYDAASSIALTRMCFIVVPAALALTSILTWLTMHTSYEYVKHAPLRDNMIWMPIRGWILRIAAASLAAVLLTEGGYAIWWAIDVWVHYPAAFK